jgi:hypothetical protein
MVAVQGVGAEGVGKPLGSPSSDVGCGSVATNLMCPRNVRLSGIMAQTPQAARPEGTADK